MHDIDTCVAKITGHSNYMEDLKMVTGNIFSIQPEIYHRAIDKVCKCNDNIVTCLYKIYNEKTSDKFDEILSKITNEYENYKIKDKVFTTNKKGREVIGATPKQLINSTWFDLIKNLERDINTYFDEKQTYDNFQAIMDKNKECRSLYKIYDMSIESREMFNNLSFIRGFANEIVNILLKPMYDVDYVIEKNWHKVSKAFNGTDMTQHDVRSMLTKYIYAKYKVSMTNTKTPYIDLIIDIVGRDGIAETKSARFLEIIDAVNLDVMDKKTNAYEFATAVKTLVTEGMQHKIIDPEIYKQLERVCEGTEGTEETCEGTCEGTEGTEETCEGTKGTEETEAIDGEKVDKSMMNTLDEMMTNKSGGEVKDEDKTLDETMKSETMKAKTYDILSNL